jgi:hypothetical protein
MMKGLMSILASLSLTATLPAPARDRAQLAAAAGVSVAEQPSLGALAAMRFNRDTGLDASRAMPPRGPRSTVAADRHAQLIAAAGRDALAAERLGLRAIAAAKFNRDTRPGDYQTAD